jgi:hypothetical protein
MKEMAARGINGIYFDDVHNPTTGCYCDHCRARWADLYGEGVPFPNDHGTFQGTGDPARTPAELRALIDFYNDSVETYFRYLVEKVHEDYPEFFVLVASGYLQSPGLRSMNTRIGAIADGLKGESKRGARAADHKVLASTKGLDMGLVLPKRDMLLAVGWAIQRDAAFGRPPHIWTHDVIGEAHSEAFSAGMVTHGAINNLNRDLDQPIWDPLNPSQLNPDAGVPQVYTASSFEWSNRLADHIKYRRIKSWVGILYSEEYLDNLTNNGMATPRDDSSNHHAELWKHHLGGLFGAAEAITEHGASWQVVNDSQLLAGQLEAYPALIVPIAVDALASWQTDALAAYNAAGGQVIYAGTEDLWWHKDTDRDGLKDAFWTSLTGAIGTPSMHVQDLRTDRTHRVHGNLFTREGSNRVLALLANDYSWVVAEYEVVTSDGGVTWEGVSHDVATENAPPGVAASSVSILLDSASLASPPVAAWELLNGDQAVALPITEENGQYKILLDQPFDSMAAVVIQMESDNPADVPVGP